MMETERKKFIKYLNRVLGDVDYEKLDQSCNGENPEYAKEVLGQMHEAFMSAYGCNYLERGGYEFVELPAVVRGRESGHIALGVVTIDLQSSGEHFGTFFLTPRGVLDQNDFSMPEENRSYIRKNFNSYDYWYTPQVEGDIHTDLNNAPVKVRELLDSCTLGQMELPKDGMNL